MSAAPPLVSVIALFDRGIFDVCLPSLFDQSFADFEILAVTGSETVAPPSDPRLKHLVIADRNPARRRNQAAQAARGAILAFIDDDAAAAPDWLTRGVGFLRADPVAAGCGGPNLRYGDATTGELVTDLLLTAPLIGAGSRAYRGGGATALARPGELHLVNLFVRKDWWDKLGGLDESMGYGAEDTEFIDRATRAGAEIFFVPGLIVRHRRRPFGLAYLRQRLTLRQQTGRLFIRRPGVYARNGGFWAALALPLLLLGLVLNPGLILPAALGYVGMTITLSRLGWAGRPWLAALAPAAFLLHHLTYTAGLWLGILKGLVGRTPVR